MLAGASYRAGKIWRGDTVEYKVRDYSYMLGWTLGEIQEMGKRAARRQRLRRAK